ncbi:MAG: SUMF1/EgtB/PvdO family nonheme iron enzyme [Symploca sp. SIO1B1]|nr:SUMF1/EgtB/PvdO family nonheme iron enzyme [Symploca sp. SIO1B1]
MADWALVIGINNYHRLRSLKYAERDAALVQDFFAQEAKFQKIFYYSDNSPEFIAPDGSSQNTQPTYANLRSFLLDFFAKPRLKSGDNFWFFFSGHGIRHQGRDYLMPCDVHPRDVDATAIPVNYITERLRRCGADNVVLLLDACRNEGSKSGLGIGMERHQGVITISSCAPSETSYEIEEIEQGAFTYALLESLRIQGEGNCATVERLYNRLRYRVTEINDYYGKTRQTPYAIAEPASKYHLILLPRQATEQDIATLREDAQDAELEGDYELAKHLWIRVLALSPADPKVLKSLERIWRKLERLAIPTRPQSTQGSGTKSQDIQDITPSPKKQGVPKLQSFDFNVVTVDSQGRETSRQRSQSEFFVEGLGNGVTLEMVAIPRGKFMMGSPTSEKGHGNSESPQHKVTVQPFFLGKYPVTQAQWKAVAALPKVNRDLETEPSWFKGDNHSVEQVSWYDAVEFCARLSKKTGRTYRLPSEAEWEYACRAKTTIPFHFGETITSKLANYKGTRTDNSEPQGEYREQTTPVGHFQVANAFGVYDMHGNVWEWCADSWHDNYQGAPTDGSTWNNDNNNDYRLLRGGSWLSYALSCRSAYRNFDFPGDLHNFAIGFRVVCEAAWTL